mmetsp:Transcript_77051/g.121664  ORF Transcript_77051/g.121664 Transcript_77051/m.121664 type:complete len:325 (-) Transcript_77051:290-1264(-)
MPSIDDIIGFTKCLSHHSVAGHSQTWSQIVIDAHRPESDAEMLIEIHKRDNGVVSDAADAPIIKAALSRRRRVSFSEELDVFTFQAPADTDGEASPQKVLTRDGAPAHKKKRSVGFSTETETATFEVYNNMTPTKDMCDETMLRLQEAAKQEAEKQSQAMRTTNEFASSKKKQWQDDVMVETEHVAGIVRNSIVVGVKSKKSRSIAKRVSFEEEAEILPYQEVDDDGDIHPMVETSKASSSQYAATHLNLLLKGVSRFIVTPSARPYLLDMRSLIGYPPSAFVELGIERRRTSLAFEFRDIAALVLSELLRLNDVAFLTSIGIG